MSEALVFLLGFSPSPLQDETSKKAGKSLLRKSHRKMQTISGNFLNTQSKQTLKLLEVFKNYHFMPHAFTVFIFHVLGL